MDRRITPGPWKFDDQCGCRPIKAGKRGDHRQAQYMEVAGTSGLYDDEEDRANAEMICQAMNTANELYDLGYDAEKVLERLPGILECLIELHGAALLGCMPDDIRANEAIEDAKALINSLTKGGENDE